MSPSECAAQGFDWGFWEHKDGGDKLPQSLFKEVKYIFANRA